MSGRLMELLDEAYQWPDARIGWLTEAITEAKRLEEQYEGVEARNRGLLVQNETLTQNMANASGRITELLEQLKAAEKELDIALAALRKSQGHVPYFGRHTETTWCERCGPKTPWPCDETSDEARAVLERRDT